MFKIYDYIVIGGGIVGLSTAHNLLTKRPGSKVALFEKAAYLAAEQTGHNSGVIHAGVYYTPGSMKARFCKEGAIWTKEFAKTHNIPFEQTGKMIVATTADEITRMQALYSRTKENDIPVDHISKEELTVREPNVKGLEALYVHDTGIIDYKKVSSAIADEFVSMGGKIYLSTSVEFIVEEDDKVVVSTVNVAGSDKTTHTRHEAKKIVACAGIQADRLAIKSGLDIDWKMIPFRGEYYRLSPKFNKVVSSLIYPVPDPSVPFLGVHLTRMIDGTVTVGPNAVLGFSRTGYEKFSVDFTDVADYIKYKGFWRLASNNVKTGIVEMWNSINKFGYLKEVQKYCPSVTAEDLNPYPAGIRAQAVGSDGKMIEDFKMLQTDRMLHVVNAPSPAATSAMPIANYITSKLFGESIDI